MSISVSICNHGRDSLSSSSDLLNKIKTYMTDTDTKFYYVTNGNEFKLSIIAGTTLIDRIIGLLNKYEISHSLEKAVNQIKRRPCFDAIFSVYKQYYPNITEDELKYDSLGYINTWLFEKDDTKEIICIKGYDISEIHKFIDDLTNNGSMD